MASLKQAPFTRVLEEGDEGIDVEGVGRAFARAGLGDLNLTQFNKLPQRSRRTYGPRKVKACRDLERKAGHALNGRYELAQHKKLLPAFDARGANFMRLWVPPLLICHPFPKNAPPGSGQCQGNHETAGVPGNWARDWCVPEIVGNGTPILAVEVATVVRLSGSDPDVDVPDPSGAFGWSVYYLTPAGRLWYWTHLGARSVKVGDVVRPGTVIGRVGDQLFRPDHVHGGVSSPKGEAEAKRHLQMIADARRVLPLAL
jgi:murein DD-endopeptidase MepM/ murein hydrolase activator NlpD